MKKTLVVLSVICVALLVGMIHFSNVSSEQKETINGLREENEDLIEKLTEKDDEIDGLNSEIERLKSQVSNLKSGNSKYNANNDKENANYIANKSSGVFHKDTCKSLPKESNRFYFYDREDAVEQGYSPCKNCKP